MAVTPIDLDEEALAAANRRQRAFERLLELGDPETGERGWRDRKGRVDSAEGDADGE